MRSEINLQAFDKKTKEQQQQFMELDKQLEEAKNKRIRMREEAREQAALAELGAFCFDSSLLVPFLDLITQLCTAQNERNEAYRI